MPSAVFIFLAVVLLFVLWEWIGYLKKERKFKKERKEMEKFIQQALSDDGKDFY